MNNSWASKYSLGLVLGKFKMVLWFKYLRTSEIRWMGKKTQWVISPVQIALWTKMETHEPKWIFSYTIIERTRENSILAHGGSIE